MITHECIAPEDVAELARLPADHPRRQDADRCPQCSALLLSYAQFSEAQTQPGADPEAAEVHLAAFIEQKITATSDRGSSPSLPRPFLLRLRPALAIAAGIVLVGTAVVLLRPVQSQKPVLRGIDSGSAAARPLSLHDPDPVADGSVRLSWRPLAEANQYQVRIYAPDLTELLRLEPLADNLLVLHPTDLPPGATAGSHFSWRVVALRDGDEIALSRPGTFRFP